jgi:hypothetical protein
VDNPGVPLELFGAGYPGGKIFNKAAFAAPPEGRQGNFGRNVLRGFDATQADVGVQRQFRVTEKVALAAVSTNSSTRKHFPAPFVPDGGLIDGKYPVSRGGTIFGNLGRNILRGPDQRDFDIALIKTTPLTDRVRLIFRWEIFNLLNRSNFANPSNDVSTASTFGTISALTVNPRIMQYALKLEF